MLRDLEGKSKKELLEIALIQQEEYQVLQKRIAELENLCKEYAEYTKINNYVNKAYVMIKKEDCQQVAVFPDGEIYEIDNIPSWKSDDYELRYQGFCAICDDTIDPHYSKPVASCKCFAQEWYI